LGSRVTAFCAQMNKNAPRALFSLPDKFIAHGDRRELLHRCGLDENTLASRICAELKGAKQHENAR
jgi:deoxyxylulose-5-phosphate synthase